MASSPSCPRPTVDALTEYGQAFGMVFQIVDDMLDITATDEQLGKPVGHDMVEGVYTLPVLRTLQAGGVAAAELLALLGKPLEHVERDKALAIVRANGGVAAAMRRPLGSGPPAREAACELLPAERGHRRPLRRAVRPPRHHLTRSRRSATGSECQAAIGVPGRRPSGTWPSECSLAPGVRVPTRTARGTRTETWHSDERDSWLGLG